MIKRLQRDAQFPKVGVLRKGGTKETKTITKNGQTKEVEVYGKDLTYFRFDTDDARAETHFRAAYGEEPTEINVYLPFQTTEQNFSCWQEAYLAGGLQHRCDGETCVIWYDAKTQKYSQEPKPCPGGCKEVGRLTVIVPELQRLAYVTAETHSINDIMRLTENLQAVESLRGDLRSIPFVLKRTPVEISTPSGDGKRARREKWLLSIEVDPAWASLQLEGMRQNALSVNGMVADESRMLTTVQADYDDDDDDGVEPSTSDNNAIPPTVAGWLNQAKPVDAAKAWAVECGAQPNEHAARTSLKKIVDGQFDGNLKSTNLPSVLQAFYLRQLEHLAEQESAQPEPEVEAEALASF